VSPVVFRLNGVKFHFYANEGNPREPVHVHASRPGCRAKLWLYPEVTVTYNQGYNRVELVALVAAVRARRDQIERDWNDFFRNSNGD
jgi:hypothetical protein